MSPNSVPWRWPDRQNIPLMLWRRAHLCIPFGNGEGKSLPARMTFFASLAMRGRRRLYKNITPPHGSTKNEGRRVYNRGVSGIRKDSASAEGTQDDS